MKILVATLVFGTLALFVTAPDLSSGIIFSPPANVKLKASNGTYDGTNSSVFVRVRSSSGWSGWKNIGPLAKGQTKIAQFATSHIWESQVWIGQNDGARVTVKVDQPGGYVFYETFFPTAKWIKNGSKYFEPLGFVLSL